MWGGGRRIKSARRTEVSLRREEMRSSILPMETCLEKVVTRMR